MSGRATLYVLLSVVAGAAAMLSFAALRDLALLCGFAAGLAWLLPVVVDAGAAAGSLVWLGERTGPTARRFARRLALGLLGLSVAANALGHGLAAYGLAPPWWVVVALSGIASAVLGAMVHLAVLAGRRHHSTDPDPDPAAADLHDVSLDAPTVPVEFQQVAADPAPWSSAGPAAPWGPPPWTSPSWTPTEWPVNRTPTSWPPHTWTSEDLPPVDGAASAEQPTVELAVPAAVPPGEPSAEPVADHKPAAVPAGAQRVAALIAAGAGRRRLSRELGVTEYEARRLLEQARPADHPADIPPTPAEPPAVDTPTSTDAPTTTGVPTTTGARA